MVDRAVVDSLIAARTRQRSPVDDLTPREREVLSHIAHGSNNKAIAEDLVLSPRAVEKHINSIFAKLGTRRGERQPPPRPCRPALHGGENTSDQ